MPQNRHSSVPDTSERAGSTDVEAGSNIKKIAAIEAEQRTERTWAERLAELVARFCGSMIFVYIHVLWFGGWILANSLTERFRFDPFPYIFLTLVVSLEAIFLSTFILISQNQETVLSEQRNHLDLQVNLLAEQESTKTLELMQLVAKKLGVECENEDDTGALLEPVDPEVLVQAIINAFA